MKCLGACSSIIIQRATASMSRTKRTLGLAVAQEPALVIGRRGAAQRKQGADEEQEEGEDLSPKGHGVRCVLSWNGSECGRLGTCQNWGGKAESSRIASKNLCRSRLKSTGL